MTRSPRGDLATNRYRDAPLQAHERICSLPSTLISPAVVRTERGVLQESSNFLYRMPPSILERVTPLANLCPENVSGEWFSRPAFAHQPVWCWVPGGRVASDRGRRLSTYWPIRESARLRESPRLKVYSAVLSRRQTRLPTVSLRSEPPSFYVPRRAPE